jgi:hypothetical protein
MLHVHVHVAGIIKLMVRSSPILYMLYAATTVPDAVGRGGAPVVVRSNYIAIIIILIFEREGQTNSVL